MDALDGPTSVRPAGKAAQAVATGLGVQPLAGRLVADCLVVAHAIQERQRAALLRPRCPASCLCWASVAGVGMVGVAGVDKHIQVGKAVSDVCHRLAALFDLGLGMGLR